MIRNILEYLEKTAKRLPDKIAFSGAEGTITFAELEETAKRIGTYLTRFGGRSCPIAVMVQKTPGVLLIIRELSLEQQSCFMKSMEHSSIMMMHAMLWQIQ